MCSRHLVIAYVVIIISAFGLAFLVSQTPNRQITPADTDKSGTINTARTTSTSPPTTPSPSAPLSFAERLAVAAEERCKLIITYDGSYQQIAYPNGDVSADRGVCSDVVIRSYRKLGIDLQELVHEDMRSDFQSYPQQ